MPDTTAPPKPADPGAPPTSPVRLHLARPKIRDAYHSLLRLSWPKFLGFVIACYLAVNLSFALAYLACGTGITNVRPGSFGDAFFFSVQTLSTIGYGQMVPRSIAAHIVVTVEALSGLLGFAMISGLMFAKFSRPTSRVLFSRYAVVSLRDGVPSLMFRMANERTNQIVEAQLHVVLSLDESTLEGESVRKFYDLPLSRNQTALFALTWTAIHPINAQSPLSGETPESLARKRANLTVSLLGFDETFSQTVHARYNYGVDTIRWGMRLADVLVVLPDGARAVDYAKFHDVVAAPLP